MIRKPRISDTLSGWLSHRDFSPFLKTGIISDGDQSDGILFGSHILVNTSVNLTWNTLPPSLYTSGVSSSGPAPLPRFRLPTAFPTSTSVGGPSQSPIQDPSG
ncbi:unnamed protein product [Heterobilharzia americana]|nr:unnamed protein product [Heterobilharzia americana]